MQRQAQRALVIKVRAPAAAVGLVTAQPARCRQDQL